MTDLNCECGESLKVGKSAVERLVMMPKTLTAENGAKGLFIGEFFTTLIIECDKCFGTGNDQYHYGEECLDCKGKGEIYINKVIDWTTIKEIYAMAVKHLAT